MGNERSPRSAAASDEKHGCNDGPGPGGHTDEIPPPRVQALAVTSHDVAVRPQPEEPVLVDHEDAAPTGAAPRADDLLLLAKKSGLYPHREAEARPVNGKGVGKVQVGAHHRLGHDGADNLLSWPRVRLGQEPWSQRIRVTMQKSHYRDVTGAPVSPNVSR